MRIHYLIHPRGRALATSCAIVLLAGIAALSTFLSSSSELHAQEVEASVPSFSNAPISEVLKWAKTATGKGFIYSGVRVEDSRGKEITITYDAPAEGSPDPFEVLQQSLRKAGLVALPSPGLKDVYQIVEPNEAQGLSPVVEKAEDLGDSPFGTLAIKVKLNSVATISALAKGYMSPHGRLTILDLTSRILVADFAANLRVIDQSVRAAEDAAERADDKISRVFAPLLHDARGLCHTVIDARLPGENYNISTHEVTNSLVVTGKRADVQEAILRLTELDSREAQKGQEIELRTLTLTRRNTREAFDSLSKYFAQEIEGGLVKLTVFSLRDQILMRSNKKRFLMAKELVVELDRPPRDQAERDREERNRPVEERENEGGAKKPGNDSNE